MNTFFWQYGYISAFNNAFAKRNRWTGRVYFIRWNETFSRYDWIETGGLSGNCFKFNPGLY